MSFERKFKRQDKTVDWTTNKQLRDYTRKALGHIRLDPMAWAISVHAVLSLVQRKHPETVEDAKLLADTLVSRWTRNNKAVIQELLLEGFDNREVDSVRGATREGFAKFLALTSEPGYLPASATGAFGLEVPISAEASGTVIMPNLPQTDADDAAAERAVAVRRARVTGGEQYTVQMTYGHVPRDTVPAEPTTPNVATPSAIVTAKD